MAKHLFTDRWNIIFLIVILIMGAEIVYLIMQNRELRSMIENRDEHLEILSENDTVPPFSAHDVHGNAINIDYSPNAPYTMLFWISPDCSVCKDNLPFYNRLYNDFSNKSIRYIALCDADAEQALEYKNEFGLAFPVISPVSPEILDSYEGDILPQTMLISPRGEIIKIWPGSLANVREDQILAILQQLKP